MPHPKLKIEDQHLLKLTTNHNEFEELKKKTEKHAFENISKTLKIDNHYYRERYITFTKRKYSYFFLISNRIRFY